MSGFVIRILRDIRLVPIVLIATVALFALKTLGLVLDAPALFAHLAGGADKMEIAGTTTDAVPARPSGKAAPQVAPPGARLTFLPGDAAGEANLADPDFTGAVTTPANSTAKEGAAPAPAEASAKKEPEPAPAPAPIGTKVPLDEHPVSPAERAILESLQKRRAELDARARELDMREDLLKAAERRVGGRIDELKELEARVKADLQQKDDAEQARFKNVVAMYESMKAKDAAKIFDGLDMRVLIDVAKAINPRTMSEILAQMLPENAQHLTMELAARPAPKGAAVQASDLPKIQGIPNPN